MPRYLWISFAVVAWACAIWGHLNPPVAHADTKAIAEKNEKVAQCHREGNIPVLGFGLTVVCIQKASVTWSWSGGNW